MKLRVGPTGILLLLGLTIILLVGGCVSPAGPTDLTDSTKSSVLSPSGWFRVDQGDYGPRDDAGAVLEDRWRTVSACLGLGYTPRAFRVVLRRDVPDLPGAFNAGGVWASGRYFPDDRIEVAGAPQWTKNWQHELMHLLLHKATGDYDDGHVRGGGRTEERLGADWVRCDGSRGGA